MIAALLVAGSTLAYVTTRYTEPEPQIIHHVTMGKAGEKSDDTVWVAEYYCGREVFNYTLPRGAVHSWFVSYADTFTVAVPSYKQNFTLERTETGGYNVYVPETGVSVAINHLGEYLRDPTVLDHAYPMLRFAIRDVRVLSKIHDKPFGINGVVTTILDRDMSTVIRGFTMTAEDKLWAVVLDEDGRVILIEEIIISTD
ncbi:hypothetical protein JXL21_11020 [Candidatus Bathyarchaeota archaeon]|nr:hypothetical protein [Candidatus Bathyarchaeota archaeon]